MKQFKIPGSQQSPAAPPPAGAGLKSCACKSSQIEIPPLQYPPGEEVCSLHLQLQFGALLLSVIKKKSLARSSC